MKTFLRILLVIGILVCLAIGGLFYSAYKFWNPSWTNEATLVGPDGYTYYFMNYSMLQAQVMKLVRTNDTSLPESEYQVLGEAYGDSPRVWASIIRPVGASDKDYGMLYITPSEDMVLGFRYGSKCFFAYDVKNETFHSAEDILNFSPYLLLNQEQKPHDTDIYAMILEVVKSTHEGMLLPGCPRPEVLRVNLNHPNTRVREITEWLLGIQNEGLDVSTNTIYEVIDYVSEGLKSKNKTLRLNAIEICGYFQNSYIEKVIPVLEKIIYEKDQSIPPVSSEAAISLGRLGEPAFPVLLKLLKSDDSSMRFYGLLGFRFAGPEANVHKQEIKLLLNDKNSNVRQQASIALENINRNE